MLDVDTLPDRSATKLVGLLLAVPDLVAMDLSGLVAKAAYLGTKVMPDLLGAVTACVEAGRGAPGQPRRGLAADPGAALFAGLGTLPKATALTSYS